MARSKQKAKPAQKKRRDVAPVAGGIKKPRPPVISEAPKESEKATDLFPGINMFAVIMVPVGDKRFTFADDPERYPTYALLGYSKAEGESTHTWKPLRRNKIYLEKKEVAMFETPVGVRQAKVKYTRGDGSKVTCTELLLDTCFTVKHGGKVLEFEGHIIVDCDMVIGSHGCDWQWEGDRL